MVHWLAVKDARVTQQHILAQSVAHPVAQYLQFLSNETKSVNTKLY